MTQILNLLYLRLQSLLHTITKKPLLLEQGYAGITTATESLSAMANIRLFKFIFSASVPGCHISNRNQPDDNDPDGASLNPANAARQLGLIDEAETTNTEHREECRYAALNSRTVMVIPTNFSNIIVYYSGERAVDI